MPKHLSDAQADAVQASAISLIFQTLEMVRESPPEGPLPITDAERGCALASVLAAAMIGAGEVWSRKIVVEAAAVAGATVFGVGPELGAFMNHWQRTLGVRFDFATANDRAERKARQDFIDMVARLETPDEYEERTSEGMSGDDAVDTIGSLVHAARRLSDQRAADAFSFRVHVPGHAVPEGGQL